MATKLPQFPSLADVYDGDLTDLTQFQRHFVTKRIAAVKCEVVTRVGQVLSNIFSNMYNPAYVLAGGLYYTSPLVLIYFPKGTDIRGLEDTATGQDTIIVDGTEIFVVAAVAPVAMGFAGEFLCAWCVIPVN